jgi:type I restriction enzyme M protein
VAKLTLAQLERHLASADDLLPKKMEAVDRKDVIFGMLFLKRCSDEFQPAWQHAYDEYLKTHGDAEDAAAYAESPDPYGDRIIVPARARWWPGPHREQTPNGIKKHKGLSQFTTTDPVAADLDKALLALEGGPNATVLDGVLRHIQFSRQTGQTRLSPKELVSLVKHFDRYSLRDEDFEFPGLLGAAFEAQIGRFAEAAGQGSDKFYTPRPIIRMMVRLVDPRSGDEIYDPCAGSAGMLLLAREHVEEHGGDPGKVALAGQEVSGSSWAMGKMNLLLHGVGSADLRNDDTLTQPMHRGSGGRLRRFDKVLSNPSFSRSFDAAVVNDAVENRMRFGTAPANNADLMFVQHMVHVLKDHGVAATVMPHGVLFRGGEEHRIRTRMLAEDAVEAVIGLAPKLFFGGGIPACVLVLRRPGGKPVHRRNQVLFINADREFRSGRAQNHLEPEHAEKIVSAFRGWREIPGYSRVVTVEELLAQDANLNIRRYVDSAPPPEPQDVSAHLDGGMPRAELDVAVASFATYGVDIAELFTDRDPADPDYLDFPCGGPGAVGARIVDLAAAREADLRSAYRHWWDEHSAAIAELPKHQRLMDLREELLVSFDAALLPLRVLDEFAITGIVAGWWTDRRYDFKALVAGGVDRVLDGWADNVLALLGPVERAGKTTNVSSADRRRALDHPVVPHLLGDFLTELEQAEAEYIEADATYKALEARATDGDSHDAADDADGEPPPTKVELSRARKAKTAANTKRRKVADLFRERLRTAVSAAKESGTATTVVLAVFDQDLASRLERHVSAGRDQLVQRYRRWSDKYEVSLSTLEADRAAATGKLDDCLRELGFRRTSRVDVPQP